MPQGEQRTVWAKLTACTKGWSWLHNGGCTIANFTLHTAHCTLHTACSTFYRPSADSHYTLHTAYSIFFRPSVDAHLHTAVYSYDFLQTRPHLYMYVLLNPDIWDGAESHFLHFVSRVFLCYVPVKLNSIFLPTL